MSKMRILAKISYGDWDNVIETPCFVSSNKDALLSKAAELNAKRTKKEIDDGVEYAIMDEIVKLI